jgi:hypothetical protein
LDWQGTRNIVQPGESSAFVASVRATVHRFRNLDVSLLLYLPYGQSQTELVMAPKKACDKKKVTAHLHLMQSNHTGTRAERPKREQSLQWGRNYTMKQRCHQAVHQRRYFEDQKWLPFRFISAVQREVSIWVRPDISNSFHHCYWTPVTRKNPSRFWQI